MTFNPFRFLTYLQQADLMNIFVRCSDWEVLSPVLMATPCVYHLFHCLESRKTSQAAEFVRVMEYEPAATNWNVQIIQIGEKVWCNIMES